MAFQNYPGATATMTVTTPILVTPARTETIYAHDFEDYSATPVPASQVYFQNFETNTTDSWLPTTGKVSNALWGGSPLSQGQRSLTVGGNNTSSTPTISRTFTGLTVGRSYTFTAIGCALAPSSVTTTGTLGVVGIGDGTARVLLNTEARTATYTFTATATSHTLRIVSTNGSTGDMATWDNITLTRDAYTDVTNDGRDGFTGGVVQSTRKRTGNYALYGTTPAKAFTGLVVGHQYTLRGWYLNGSTWTQWSETYTAASTAQAFSLPSPQPVGNTAWDDIELIHIIPAVYINTAVLKLAEGDVTIDSGRYPYVEANVEVPFTGEDLLEQLEINQRVAINATEGKTAARFNLALRDRTVSHDGKRITLKLASDEALLDTWADVVDDSFPRTFETNLRGLVNYALGKAIPGAALQTGTTNASIPAAWNAENLIPDPRLVSDPPLTTYANLGHSSWDTVFPGPQDGVAHRGIHVSTPSNSDSYVNIGPTSGKAFSVQEGKTYVFSATGSVRAVITGTGPSEVDAAYGNDMPRQRALVVHATGPGFSPAYKVWHSPQVANVVQTGASAGYRVSVKFTVPRGTTDVFLRAYHGGTSGSITWSQFQLVEAGPGTTAEDAAYFWGSKPADGKYAYKWRDLPDKSPSERTAIQERSPALFTWRAGQTAWDFLSPLVASAGLRLFCDEQRRWYLIDPATHVVPGRFSARPDNAVEGTDTIDANDEDAGVTGVVAVFEWTDMDGISHEVRDAAGVAGKVKVLTFKREYTGPGIAAAHLAKVTGQNRTQDVTVNTDYTVRPGQEVQIDLPGTFAQLGTLTKVRWELTTGLMSLASAQLRETPPGSIDLLTPTIDGLTGSIDSL